MEKFDLELHTVRRAEGTPKFDDSHTAQVYANEFGGQIYTWHCEGRQNWLERGVHHYDSIAWVVLPYALAGAETYDLPDDEPGEVEVELPVECLHTLAPNVCITCVNDELQALDIPVTIVPKFIEAE
jgi:hypothetical protein